MFCSEVGLIQMTLMRTAIKYQIETGELILRAVMGVSRVE
jgi:hypothetical protein